MKTFIYEIVYNIIIERTENYYIRTSCIHNSEKIENEIQLVECTVLI